MEVEDEGIVYPYHGVANNSSSMSSSNNHIVNDSNSLRVDQHPQNLFEDHNNKENDDQMVCAAMSILLCPPHEGIAREYQELPPTQQNQVWSDLTGSETATILQTDESPEAIHLAIGELAYEIDKIPTKHKQAFEMALANFPDFVNDPSFILRFLRAERFDANLTAARLVLHFEQKLELFGPDKLGREILLSDLEEDDMDCINRGYLQILHKKDFSGRNVVFFYKAISDCYKRRENVLRIAWYMYNKLAQDPTAQKLGVINVVYNNGGFPEKGMDYEKSRRFGMIIKSMPLRVDGMFVCLDEAPWLAVVEAFSMMVNKFLRIRLRALSGSHTECMYKLMSIGLPYTAMPVDANSQLILKQHKKWLKKQHEIETSGTGYDVNTSMIIT